MRKLYKCAEASVYLDSVGHYLYNIRNWSLTGLPFPYPLVSHSSMCVFSDSQKLIHRVYPGLFGNFQISVSSRTRSTAKGKPGTKIVSSPVSARMVGQDTLNANPSKHSFDLAIYLLCVSNSLQNSR